MDKGNSNIEPARELCAAPRWRAEDLGQPLPAAPHANSVCLPEWQDVIDYEEKKSRVISRLQAGYPRFVVPPECAKLFEKARAAFAGPDEKCHVYPSKRSAERCAENIRRWSGASACVVAWPGTSVFIVLFPSRVEESAMKHWRHTGDGVSSRRAAAMLAGNAEINAGSARDALQRRIAGLAGVSPEQVYLFKSGMAAIYALHRAATALAPGARCVQFGFPYVDTLKILQDFGSPCEFFPMGDASDLVRLRELAGREQIAGVFCEFPSNPLLASPDLVALSELSRKHGFPLIVDDTISTWANVDLLPAADVVVSSLTKWFTGRGDVMAGSIVLNHRSPRAAEFRAALDAQYEDCIWAENLVRAERDSRDFEERVRRSNETAERVCDWLKARPEVESVFYPKFMQRELYDAFKRPGGGYGGLFSLVLRDAARTSPAFFNKLEISKGPNLGTMFSLCCPFTLLAHYGELAWAESCGVSRNLMRYSIGLEDADDLIARFGRAFV